MRRIYTELKSTEKRRLDEAHIGVFYYIDSDVYADSVKVTNGESYGGFITHGSHFEFYEDELGSYVPDVQDYDYDYYPRGRVVFNRELNKYILYLDEDLNQPSIIEKIAEEFGLSNGSFIIDTDDEHYKHLSKEPVH